MNLMPKKNQERGWEAWYVNNQPPPRPLAHQGTRLEQSPVQNNGPSGKQRQTRTKMIGDKVVYDLGGGAMSTMNLQSTGGCGYRILDDTVHVVGSNNV